MKFLVFLLLAYFNINVDAIEYTQIALKVLDAYISEMLDSPGNKTECGNQLKIYVADIKSFKVWALQMLDSTAKMHAGILTGNLVQIGNYDECLEINVNRNGSQIKGQYCRSILTPSKTVNECINRNFAEQQINALGKTALDELQEYVKIQWHVCIPAACAAAELQSIWDFAEDRYEFKFHLLFVDDLCSTVEKLNYYSPLHIAAMTAFGIIGLVVLSSTLYDIFIFQKRKDKEYDFFMAFSFYTNAKRLFSVNSSEDTKITCLQGIRVISMAWIVLGHHCLLNYIGTAVNFAYAGEWLKHEENMFIIGAFACVDSFLVISGFLIVYGIMLAKENGIEVNLLAFYVHRFLRLTPSLAATILVYVGILPHLGSGPYWNYVDAILIQPCIKHWWSTLLFIQNYLHPMEVCIIQTWYLSVDTHLYLLSPLLFLPLQRWPKTTIVFIVGLILISTGSVIHATYYYEIDSISIKSAISFFEEIYNPTHMRVTPWLAGVLLGYFMFKYRNKKMEIKKKYVLLLWAACIVLMLVILYGYIAFFNVKFTILMVAVFNALSRPIWGACICWVIFACSRGYGGYINKFLSLSIFNILGRLTFSMYLTHLLIVSVVQGQRGTSAYVYNLFHFYEVWGDFAFTTAFSIIWTLTFESSITILEKVIIQKALEQNKKSNKTSKGL